jgi:hypothetical protein
LVQIRQAHRARRATIASTEGERISLVVATSLAKSIFLQIASGAAHPIPANSPVSGSDQKVAAHSRKIVASGEPRSHEVNLGNCKRVNTPIKKTWIKPRLKEVPIFFECTCYAGAT